MRRSPFSRRALTAAAASALALGVIGAAAAAPGTPRVPSAPEVLLHETFESGMADGEVTVLSSYGSGAYSADAAWLDVANGNGLVADGTTSDTDFTAAGFTSPAGTTALRELATKLGELNGTSPNSANHAVTAYTASADPGANGIEFETVNPINLNAGGRFLSLSANVGVVNCHAAHPQLQFFLLDGGVESAVNSSPLDPCGGSSSSDARATTLIGGEGVLFTGDQVGIRMRNAQGSGGGNDHAFDDVRVLDVTPQLDKVFTDEGDTLQVGEETELVLTVTNTSELGEKSGWSFTDHLPKGLTVATPTVLTPETCQGTITADEGDDEISIEDGVLPAGAEYCEIRIFVTSKSKGGVFENSAENIESVGLNDPGATSIEYVAPVAAPDTGVERTAMWPTYTAISAGLLMLVALGTWQAVARRRD